MLDDPLMRAQRGADAVARSRSIYCGDGEAYATLRRSKDWNAKLRNLESLDYEVIDNRSFRRTGRHTANVAKWAITLVIGTVVGLLAFFMEHAITLLVRARLAAIARAATAAARFASSSSKPFLFRFLLFGHASWAPTAAAFAVAVLTASGLASVASALVVFVAPAATGAGVALVMASLNGVHVPELLCPSTIAVKVIGAALAVASGAPVGPEGPLVHVGAGVASLCTRQMTAHGGWLDAFHNDADGRDFLSAGVAAGLAAAYGAPVGGVLFSLEEASTHWSHATTWRSLTCAALAVFVSAVARALTPREGVFSAKSSASLMSLSGSTGLIPIPYARDGLARSERSNASTATPSSSESRDASAYFLWELPLFAALGAVAAVIGALLTRSSSALSSRRPKTPRARVLEAALVSGACAAIAIIAAAAFGACASRPTNKATLSGSSDADGGDYVFGLVCPRGRANDLGTLLLGLRDDIISDLLSSSSDFTPTSIAIALVILLVTIPIACDCSFPAGLFMPTIAWGACLGSLWGVAARELVRRIAGADVANAVSPGSYAVVGAASALAGMFRSSISLVVIMVEGTGRVGALMPLILGVAVANIVGPKVHDESFYEAQLRAKGVPFLRQHHACAPASPRKSHGESHDAFSTQCTVESLIKNPPRCLTPIPHVGCIEDLLLSATHNGFPVVLCDPPALEADSDASRRAGNGKLVGFILRSQLMVLLARREFLERFDACDDNSFNVTLDRIDSNDTAMRTFHHRHHFGDRGISSSAEAVRRLGLTTDERSKRIDLWNYMKLAPLAVHAQCSAWRAAGYFRAAGLRHLPVVDFNNRVVGVLTRRDLVPGFGTQGEGEGADGYADMRARAFLCNDWSDEDEDTDQAVSSKDVTLSNVVTFSL